MAEHLACAMCCSLVQLLGRTTTLIDPENLLSFENKSTLTPSHSIPEKISEAECSVEGHHVSLYAKEQTINLLRPVLCAVRINLAN